MPGDDLTDRMVLRPPVYDAMRERVVPMIRGALKRTSLFGLDVVGWDYVIVPMANAMITGFAIAIRGFDLSGPGKELMQFRQFPTWQPDQDTVDAIVAATVTALREIRDEQGRQLNRR